MRSQFGMGVFIRASHKRAHDQGWDAGYLGLDKANPYPVGSNEYINWNWGWEDAISLLEEFSSASYNPSDEWGCERD